MMQLRVVCEAGDSGSVVDLLGDEPGTAHIVVTKGVSRQPPGGVVEAVVAREATEDVPHRLADLGVQRRGGRHDGVRREFRAGRVPCGLAAATA
jgi:hypothetical protein